MKYIITTDTITTREYLSDGRGSLLTNRVEVWVEEIQRVLSDTMTQKEGPQRFVSFLRNDCSERKFVSGIETMVKSLR